MQIEKPQNVDINMLSKRAINQINETIKPYGRKIKHEPIDADEEPVDMTTAGMINERVPRIVQALLGKENGLEEVQLCDQIEFFRTIIAKVVQQKSFNDVSLVIGLGGSENMPSLRLPAYIIPGLKMLRAFHKLTTEGKIIGMPNLRIFKADAMAKLVNGFDETKLAITSEKTLEFMRRFIERFFPELVRYIHLETDDNLNQSGILEHIRQTAKLFEKIESIKDELASLLKMGQKRGGEKGTSNALLYAAAHPFYDESLMPEDTVGAISTTREKSEPAIVIDIGGRPQKTFNVLTESIRKNPATDHMRKPPTIRVITGAGKIPVYYPARDGDALLGKKLPDEHMTGIDRLAQKDFKLIFDAVGREPYENFIHTL